MAGGILGKTTVGRWNLEGKNDDISLVSIKDRCFFTVGAP